MMGEYTLDQFFIHRTTTHDCRIRWTRLGNPTSPSLVFIHGTPWSSIEWHDLAGSLSTRYNIYLYDHPGFGDSPPFARTEGAPGSPQEELDGPLTRRTEASAALFKHWDLAGPPHVVCHDNAGLVSLRLLLQHGVQFASLCLIDVVALGPFGLPFFKQVVESERIFKAIPSHLAEGFVRAYVKSAAHKPLWKEVEDLLCAPWLAGGSQGSERFLEEMMQAHYRDSSDVQSEYARVGGLTPTKIIWGRKDAWIPAGTAQKLKEALNAKEVVVVEEAGHLIQYDQPSRLAVEVALWLDKNSSDNT